jgi:hypothetical protein
MRLRREMREINSWLEQAGLSLAGSFPHIDTSDRRLRRCFNNSRFDHGGRFSGGWWTNLSKTIKREHLRIGGERVALLDYNNLYPRLAYAIVGVEPEMDDLYTAIPGLERHRKGAQVLFNSLLFDGKPRTRKPRGTAVLLPEDAPVGELIKAIERTHAPIAKVLGRGIGFELMHTESSIMVGVLLYLRDLGTVALPVYDCLIVARSAASTAVRAMEEIGREMAGCHLPVVVDAEGIDEEDDDIDDRFIDA